MSNSYRSMAFILLTVGGAFGLAERDAQPAQLVKLHGFAGLSVEQAAEVLAISARTAYRDWAFGQDWLYREVGNIEPLRAPNQKNP